jgi:FMN phosphatase YigB (HAD superfamily)
MREHVAPVVLVDLGGVLFTFDHRHRLDVLSVCTGLSPVRLDALLWRSGFSAACDAGRYPDAAAVRAEIRRITGYSGTDDALDAAWCSAFRPDPAVLDALAIDRDDKRYGVFTNNGPLEEAALTRYHPSVFAPLSYHFFCHRLVANKPDPAVFRQVVGLLGVTPDRVVLVDDDARNVDAARACGWQAIRYEPPGDIASIRVPT